MLERQTISSISISELCKEAGVNRATFYNHYSAPVMILRDIAWDYADRLRACYESARAVPSSSSMAAASACLTYLYKQKAEIRLLFSNNTENYMTGFGLDIVNDHLRNHREFMGRQNLNNADDLYLYAITTASAAYGLVQAWLVGDFDKTPEEIVEILTHIFGEHIL